MQSMDKHLENPRELSSFVREAFETLPTSAAYAFALSYADADNCDILTLIALKRCNMNEKLQIGYAYFESSDRKHICFH